MASRQAAEASKLERLQQLTLKLKDDLDRTRIPVSEASKGLIEFTSKTSDPLITSSAGTGDNEANPFLKGQGGKCTLV